MNLTFPDSLLHWILVGASAATVAFFSGGLTLYFERGPRSPWVLAVHYSALLLAVVQVAAVTFLPVRSDLLVGVAIGMYLAALALFLAAIEAAKRTRLQRSFIDHPLPDRLITDGPFRWVRHPFCTGYLLGALAGPVGIDHVAMILIAAPLALVSVYAAFREERVWMASSHADEYRAYRARTGMFIPFIGRR